ncbi:hypothetical protein NQ318_005052 [Aromia moschata]|uniref:Uncharacterized protein n=1 Tax=Aromia moschata TaxID=1265417 RepID=A0AAV8YGN4_9CUCU|nr:hypothetical protein NQ318_005052 [Aromia moschata]
MEKTLEKTGEFYMHANEVDETMKRIQSHKGVVGTIIVNSEDYEKNILQISHRALLRTQGVLQIRLLNIKLLHMKSFNLLLKMPTWLAKRASIYSDGKRNYELFKWYTPIPIEYLRWRSSVAKGSIQKVTRKLMESDSDDDEVLSKLSDEYDEEDRAS